MNPLNPTEKELQALLKAADDPDKLADFESYVQALADLGEGSSERAVREAFAKMRG